jgi:catechol 2,3-dioxygenase
MQDPEEVTAAGAPVVADIPPETRMGAVHLSVSDLGRSIAYYESAIGLRVHSRDGARAALGTGGEDLLVLTERPGARPATGFCGLYHFALLVPERADLARYLMHAAREQVPLTGLSDHFVSEAIYLRDPDAHGIEIYWDRPRELWEGEVAQRLTTLQLDVRDLVRGVDASAFDGLAGGTVMGHVHFRVADVLATNAFSAGVLGFGVMASLGDQATFLSAGGYHHHIGANTWESAGRPPAPEGTARLERATIVLPDAAALDRLTAQAEAAGFAPEPLEDGGVGLRDPSGNPVALVTASESRA